MYDISAELCSESTEFGGVRCNVDIYEQLQLTHSLIISGSQYVLDGRLEVSVDQASSYSELNPEKVVEVTEKLAIHQDSQNKAKAGRKYSNLGKVKVKGRGKHNLLTTAISHSFQQKSHGFNRSIDAMARTNSSPLKLPHLNHLQRTANI